MFLAIALLAMSFFCLINEPCRQGGVYIGVYLHNLSMLPSRYPTIGIGKPAGNTDHDDSHIELATFEASNCQHPQIHTIKLRTSRFCQG